MNITHLVKKNHIFKNRKKNFYQYFNILFFNNYKTSGIYFLNRMRFEIVYLKTFKKVLKQKKIKKGKAFSKRKYWLTIRPNFLLTMKSKNARMGSGVGSYVRVCYNVYANKPCVLLRSFSLQRVRNILKYLKLKLNMNLYYLYSLNK